MIALTRRYRIAAAHVLRSPEFSDALNERVFGKCANPHGHGHNYGIEITVTGRVDPETGSLVSREALDQVVGERVLSRFEHRMLNDDPLFHGVVPTAENIARAIHEQLAEPIARRTGAQLVGVRVVETRRNHFDLGSMR